MNKQNDLYIDSLYLHFPFCVHLCNYCDFFKRVTVDKSYDYEVFHQYLEKSFSLHESLMNEHGYSWGPLKTFYIGGGTPSLWGQEGKIFLENFFHQHNLTLDPQCEFTLEVNPGAWTEDSLSAWRALGANRFSLGVQSLDKDMIRYLDRVHSIEQVYETLEYFNKHQLNFSMDFMLGLPFSADEKLKKRDVIAELKEALKYNPSHFSVYILTVKNNYPHYQDLPSEEWIAEEYLAVAEFLKSSGFHHYEVSNFAKPNRESDHNLNYWQSKTVAAFGPSATGFLSEKKLRYKWKVAGPEVDLEQLSEDEFNLENLYMGLRSKTGIRLNDFVPSVQKQKELIKLWSRLDYLEIDGPLLKLSSKGFLFLDSIIQNIF
jgi:oxygen-independent coproporphyrinogen-3 oxidase